MSPEPGAKYLRTFTLYSSCMYLRLEMLYMC